MSLTFSPLTALAGSARIPAAANDPIRLDDPAVCYLVTTGEVMLFSVPFRGGDSFGTRRHVATMGEGTLLFGATPSTLGLIVTGNVGTELASFSLEALRAASDDTGADPDLVAGIEAWVAGVSAVFVPRRIAGTNRRIADRSAAVDLQPGPGQALASADRYTVEDDLLWVELVAGSVRASPASSTAATGPDLVLDLPPQVALPLVPESSLLVVEDSSVDCCTTEMAITSGHAWAGLAALAEAGLAFEADQRFLINEREAARLRTGDAMDLATGKEAASEIAGVLSPQSADDDQAADTAGAVISALQIVGDATGFAIVPGLPDPDADAHAIIKAAAKASRIRMRTVRLIGPWYRRETLPMIAFTTSGGVVAILPKSGGGAELVDPARRARAAVDGPMAETLQGEAFTFYLGFSEIAERGMQLARFALAGSGSDVPRILVLGFVGGLLALFPPLVAKAIFNSVIPEAAKGRLVALVVAMIAAAVAAGLFQVARGIAQIRLESRGHQRLESATWDRLLRLPPSFFRSHSVGDLAMRAQAVSTMRQQLAAIGVGGMLSSLFSLLTIGLLFYLSVPLAILGIVLLIPAVLSTIFGVKLLIRRSAETIRFESETNSLVVQLLSGLPKLRTANAEVRAFGRWAHAFAAQRRSRFGVQAVSRQMAVFNAAFPAFTTLALFATIIVLGQSTISSGTFVAFSAAYAQFVVATLGVTMAIGRLMSLVPVFERTRPIFDAHPEVDSSKAPPGALSGAIELGHVSFRYDAEGPLITDDVTFSVEAGEYIALVGPSGSGKSSIMRLLLGFELPESGTISFDSCDLATLDVEDVRRQIGVVLQSARLTPGSIYSNIAGSFGISSEDAWEAAERAGLADDIRAMPMGMETLVSEGGGTFSGGQKQRLIIARALAAKPKILLFDEATSALDNATQQTVTESLGQIDVTRIVIAHRLSTIIGADRIIVLDRGKVIQIGSYDDLILEPGLFAELAARQIV